MKDELIAVQAALKAPKGQFNRFGGYRYRSCEDVLEAAKPLLSEHGLLLTLTDEPVTVGGRTYVRATATATDGKESVSVSAYAREPESKKGMDASQVTGSASSYARKYALNGLLLIDDERDADATNDHGRKSPPRRPQEPPQGPQGRRADPEAVNAAYERLKAAYERLKAACEAYEARHPRPGKPGGWALDGTKLRSDVPPKGSPDDVRVAWMNMVAEEFEGA